MYDKDQLEELIEEDFEKGDYQAAIDKMDSILNNEPYNIEALKVKAEMLYFASQYETALKICDEILQKNETDIEALKLKADILLQLSKYLDCVIVCRQILQIDPKNNIAKSTMESASIMGDIPDKICGKNPSLSIVRNVFIFAAILILLIILHPTKETMLCDGQFHCNVEHQFCNLLTVKEEYNLNSKTTIDFKTSYSYSKHGGYYHTKVKYDEIRPFIMYISSDKWESDAEEFQKKEHDKFLEYLKNPNKNYFIESYADPVTTYIWLFVYLIVLISVIVPKKIKKDEYESNK